MNFFLEGVVKRLMTLILGDGVEIYGVCRFFSGIRNFSDWSKLFIIGFSNLNYKIPVHELLF